MSDDNTMRETVRRARELRAFVSAKPDDWSEHNALIAAGLCNDELPALCDDNEQLRAELARVTAERDEVRAELLRCTAERDALRAIVEGRTVAPTLAEARAVREARGAFVRSPVYLDGFCGRFAEVVTGLARLGSESEDQRRALARWFVIDRDGRPCAWPVVEVSR